MHLCDLDDKNREINSKNIRLNDEIARRIVAESNLTKYNKTLERLIESKTKRIKEALTSLEQVERQLFTTQKAAIISDVSTLALEVFDQSNTALDTYLHLMGDHRTQIKSLLEKYYALEQGLTEPGDARALLDKARASIEEIKTLKQEMDLDGITHRYPEIIDSAITDCEKISSSVSDVKRFVVINDEIYETIDVNQIIETIRDKKPGSKKDAIVQYDLQSTPIVPLPRQNLTEAIEAVIENAVQAIAPNGNIFIVTRYEAANIYIHVTDAGGGNTPKSGIPNFHPPTFQHGLKKERG